MTTTTGTGEEVTMRREVSLRPRLGKVKPAKPTRDAD